MKIEINEVLDRLKEIQNKAYDKLLAFSACNVYNEELQKFKDELEKANTEGDE